MAGIEPAFVQADMAPMALRTRPQWLVWRFESKKGAKKPQKIPYYAGGGKRQGVQGSDADRAQLVSYEAAIAALKRASMDGIGFAFLPGDGLIGIDLDEVIDTETGELSERAAKIVKACDSYTERSPSGLGLHIIVEGETESFRANDIGVEVYCGRQFFTFTGRPWQGTPSDIRPIDDAVLRRLRATVDEAKGRRKTSTPSPVRAAGDLRAKVESALAFVSPDCGYNDWISVGMSIRAELGDGGMDVWDRWSARGQKYPGTKTLAQHWRSFPDTAHEGPLYRLATDAGWRSPRNAARGKPSSPTPVTDTVTNGEGENAVPVDSTDEIILKDDQLPAILDRLAQILAAGAKGARVYRRGTQLVQLVRAGPASARECGRTRGRLVIRSVTAAGLQDQLGRLARFYRPSRDGTKLRPVALPMMYANALLARSNHELPALTGIMYAPTLRPDGTFASDPGYDAATGLYLDFEQGQFPAINPCPTKDDAIEALSKLTYPLSDFPVKESSDMAVLLASIITCVIRPALPSAPGFGYSAPTMGAGKTLAAKVASMIATGASAPVTPPPTSDNPAEFEKTVSALILDGRPIILIDNVESVLESPYLAALLTSENSVIRVLGSSMTVVMSADAVWLFTGINLQVAGDLTTRILIVMLDPGEEHPEQRAFDLDLHEYIPKHRPELVVAALTVILGFLRSGIDPATLCKPWGRFEKWSDWVRAPLIWLGWPDPCEVLKRFDATDPRRTELAAVLSTWHGCRGTDRIKVRDLVDSARGDGEACTNLREALQAVAGNPDGSINVRRLGRWIARHVGRISGGLCIDQAGAAQGQSVWRLVEQPQ